MSLQATRFALAHSTRHVIPRALLGYLATGAHRSPLTSSSSSSSELARSKHSWSWSHVPQGPEDAILGITVAYKKDPAERKINLGVGAYRDDEGLPVVLNSVRKAERMILEEDHPMEYLPVAGDKEFIENAKTLAYGSLVKDLNLEMAAIQTLSGTGACRMAGDLLSRFWKGGPAQKPLVLMPNPTWANHTNIFKDAGCDIQTYRYYKPATRGFDFHGMVEDLHKAPPGTVVLLHACAHNPTGADPNHHEWDNLSLLFKERKILPLFDMAYQGFTSGDAEEDAYAVRKFVSDGHRIMLAQSFSKNFGLYGHRVGALSVITDNKEEASAVESQLKIIARPMYSNPPIHGVRIINTIMEHPQLEAEWRVEMKAMADRIKNMRVLLEGHLEALKSPHNWEHITGQHGMFCYSGLTPEQVKRMRDEFHIYLTLNGRISMAGVGTKNVEYLAHAMHEVTK